MRYHWWHITGQGTLPCITFQVGGASSDAFGNLAAMAWESRCAVLEAWGILGIFGGFGVRR